MALPFDKRNARRKQRAEVRKPRTLMAPARTAALFGVIVSADGTRLPLKEAETSVRRRFLGSSRISHNLPVSGQMGCRT
jgi:hypothetical protein